jgi:hypothetical protein
MLSAAVRAPNFPMRLEKVFRRGIDDFEKNSQNAGVRHMSNGPQPAHEAFRRSGIGIAVENSTAIEILAVAIRGWWDPVVNSLLNK